MGVTGMVFLCVLGDDHVLLIVSYDVGLTPQDVTTIKLTSSLQRNPLIGKWTAKAHNEVLRRGEKLSPRTKDAGVAAYSLVIRY